jgi:methionine sulfoxide reductase heme-binding subunit
MMSALAASVGPSAYWYLTRSTGAVALLLLTVTVALGVIDVRRYSTPNWPRFLVDALHRNVALLSIVFLVLHILTAVLDSFAPIGLIEAVIPFVGAYRPFWLGLGAVAFDLLLAVTITSMLRRHFGHSLWRRIHWLSYAAWPVAVLHGFGTGSDVKDSWLLVLNLVCLAAVLGAVLTRALAGWPARRRVRAGALAGAGAFSMFLLLWLPSGPLGREWARRSGTPPKLLGTAHHTKTGKGR